MVFGELEDEVVVDWEEGGAEMEEGTTVVVVVGSVSGGRGLESRSNKPVIPSGTLPTRPSLANFSAGEGTMYGLGLYRVVAGDTTYE